MAQQASQQISGIERQITQIVARHTSVAIAILFGSTATGHARPDSDLDLAISTVTPHTSEARIALIEDLALTFGRPVDLIDLDQVHSPLLHRILTQGRMILCNDRTRYAELLLRMVYEEADVMPYYRRILSDRRHAWIGT
jgi:predicted nucleotidyltransferase